MEPITDTVWDVVICGTDLQQSLLALALSRSDKKILHIDPNEYYGGAEASLTLQEADAWAVRHGALSSADAVFSAASAGRPNASAPDSASNSASNSASASAVSLGPSRSYALALAPQLLHCRSALVSQLVSSRVYRQLEFLAVSFFFVIEASSPSSSSSSAILPTLVRIPATREDVFATTALAPRAKRQLMKFLKFVLAYGEDGEDGEDDESAPTAAQKSVADRAAEPLGAFLQSEFGLDDRLRDYVLALTMSLEGASTTVADGLSRLHRHITSMGAFGPGFAAVYPKWGGCSEIAQVACRAGAVGGAVYMLGAGIRKIEGAADLQEQQERLSVVELTTGERIQARTIVGSQGELSTKVADADPSWSLPENRSTRRYSRLVAVVGTALPFLFEPPVEGAPVACGAVVAIPAGQPVLPNKTAPEHPVFAMVHSSDTGECPPGQCVLYLTTLHSSDAKTVLEQSLDCMLASFAAHGSQTADTMSPKPGPPCLYTLYYEQKSGYENGGALEEEEQQTGKESVGSAPPRHRSICLFPPLAVDLTVTDASLDLVRGVWERIVASPTLVREDETGERADEDGVASGKKGDALPLSSYMVFEDREGLAGLDQDDETYD